MELRDNPIKAIDYKIGDILEIKKLMLSNEWIFNGKIVYIKDNTLVVDCGKYGIETLSTDDRLNFRTIIKKVNTE